MLFQCKIVFQLQKNNSREEQCFLKGGGEKKGLNSDGSTSSELRDRLHAQENKSSKFSRSSGMWSRTESVLKSLAAFTTAYPA